MRKPSQSIKRKRRNLVWVFSKVRFHSTSQFHKRRRNRNANTKQLSTSEFVYKFQNTIKKCKDCNFLLHWFTGLVHANVIIHRSVGKKPSIFTSLHSRLGEYPGLFTSTSVKNCSLVTNTEGNNCFTICLQLTILCCIDKIIKHLSNLILIWSNKTPVEKLWFFKT